MNSHLIFYIWCFVVVKKLKEKNVFMSENEYDEEGTLYSSN